MYDTIALLVGRVILAWGMLDQGITGLCTTIQLGRGNDFVEPDDRFKHRLRLLRREYAKLTGDDKALLARFDKLQTEIRELERKRALLAHGSVTLDLWGGDGVIVNDRRETKAYRKGFRELMERRAGIQEGRALWDKHHNIKFTSAELERLREQIIGALHALHLLHIEVRQRSRELGIAPPLPH